MHYMFFCCDLKCMLCLIWFGGMALICMCATGVAQQLCSSQREACKWNAFHHPSSAGCLDWYRVAEWRVWLIPPMSRRAWKDRALWGSQFIQFRMLKSDVCMMSVNGMTNAELRVFYYVLSLRRAHGRLLITRYHKTRRTCAISKFEIKIISGVPIFQDFAGSTCVFAAGRVRWGLGSRAGVSHGCVRSMLRESEQLQLLISRPVPSRPATRDQGLGLKKWRHTGTLNLWNFNDEQESQTAWTYFIVSLSFDM